MFIYLNNITSKMETKSDRFKRIATRRVVEILDKFRLLGNCSNKNTYDYSEEDLQKIFSALDLELKILKTKFKANRKSKGFKL